MLSKIKPSAYRWKSPVIQHRTNQFWTGANEAFPALLSPRSDPGRRPGLDALFAFPSHTYQGTPVKIAIAFLCSFLFLAQSHAATTELRPAGPTSGAYRWQCAATKFQDTTTIAGVCMERLYGAGSGRGGGYRPPTLIGIWATTWDHTGTPTVDYSAATLWPGCQGTGETAEVYGTYYYFIAADSLGDELVETNCISYLVTP